MEEILHTCFWSKISEFAQKDGAGPGIPALLHCAQLPGSPVAWRAASALANLAEWPELVPTLQEASGRWYLSAAGCCWEVKC